MKFKLALLLVPAALLIAGCQERYRYPCQDPENWSEKYCQKPYCSANGTCPEDLTHYEKLPASNGNKGTGPNSATTINKGECNKC